MTDNELICSRCGGVILPDQLGGGPVARPPMHAQVSICFAVLRARVAELEAADQWHPVSEPPDKDGEHLIYRQPDLKYQPNARPDAAMMDVADYHAGRTNAKGELNEWSHNAIFMPITHWRPLPTPP